MESERVHYYLKLILSGSFPGSPDVDYIRLTEQEWDEISKRFSGRWKDTQEEL